MSATNPRMLVYLATCRICDAMGIMLDKGAWRGKAKAACEAFEQLIDAIGQFRTHADKLDAWLGRDLATEIIRIVSDADDFTIVHLVAQREKDYAASIRRTQEESGPDLAEMRNRLDWLLRAMRGRLRYVDAPGQELPSRGWTTNQLAAAAHCSSDTISRAARECGIDRPGIGKSNHRYTDENAKRLMQHIADTGSRKNHRDAANRWLKDRK